MDDQPKRGRPPGAEKRLKTQLRLFRGEQRTLERAARRAGYIGETPRRGYSTWVRDLGLLVARGRMPTAARDWLRRHGLVPKRRAA